MNNGENIGCVPLGQKRPQLITSTQSILTTPSTHSTLSKTQGHAARTIAKSWVSPSPFCPKRSILEDLFKFLAVGCGLTEIPPFGELKWHVAICRQTVEALSRRCRPLGSGTGDPGRCEKLGAAPHQFTRTTGGSLRRVIALRLSKGQRFKYPTKSHP